LASSSDIAVEAVVFSPLILAQLESLRTRNVEEDIVKEKYQPWEKHKRFTTDQKFMCGSSLVLRLPSILPMHIIYVTPVEKRVYVTN
jgi:hypothetical protein